MKKAKKKGKSYSQGWFERQSRRFMSVLLCSSMLSTSVANTAAFAAATSEGGDERQEFSLEKEVLRQAIRDAAKKGKTVKEDAFTFSGDEAETYEGLFEEGNLYELHPDFEKKNDRLTLKMYARLEDEEDMDQYTISGNEEIIFLMTNSSSKERTGRILVDGRASAWMTVAPFGEVKKQVGLETEEAVPVEIENEVKEPESAVPAGSEDITEEDTALEDDVKEQENASDAGNNQIKEENSDPEKQDEAEQKAQEPNTGDSENTLDIKEKSEAADGKKDLSEPDSENENEKADMDASETDTSDANTSDADTSGADTSDADTSDSENDSAQDEDSVQVSRSAHFSMFLTSAAMASPSDAKEEENENDENEKNKAIVGDEAEEDNFERILGDSYETVGIKNASAAAFVTSAMELGLTDVAVLSAVEVEEIPHWQISKSKKATNLDENFESQVTLSLPSAEEQLVSDVVLVLDKSTSMGLKEQALEMLQNLKKEVQEKGAKVKVGVVLFNKEAHTDGFMDLETQYEAIEAAICQEIKSGTNLHAGILAGKSMLDQDTGVADERKTLVVVSDGITYMFNENPTAVAWGFMADSPKHFAGPDNWKSKYGNNQAPTDWNAWLTGIGARLSEQKDTHDYPYGTEPDASLITPVEEAGNYVNSIDKALYLSYEAYAQAASEGYHCYAMPITPPGTASNYEWGMSFMRYLANGKQVSFESIENDILYAVDKGSVVKDYMGYVKEDYNFDFDHLDQLTVGGKALSMYQEGNTWYFGDGEPGPQNYRFKVVYDAGNKAETEMFTWYINEPVSNFAPVQLTYTVKLINPKTADGTYGKYDRDGSQHYEGLYTNQEAVLYPVDSRGNEYRPEEFPKPTVSYVVEHGSQEPGPDPNPTPNPGNNGGGSHGGHGGGSSSGSKKSSTTTASGPAAQPTELVTPVVPEPQPVVPAEGLPKTGDTDRMDVPMALLAIGMMAAAYVLMTGRKKTEE